MTAKNLQNLKTYLDDTGFIQKDEHVFTWAADQGRAPHRKQLPWQIVDWTLELSGQDLLQTSFEAQLHYESLVQNCEELLRERFDSFRAIALQDDSEEGFWLLFEFLDRSLDADQSRLIEQEDLQQSQLPHGMAGLHLTVIQAQGQLSVFMTKHFFLGNVPGQLLIEFPKIMTEALFGDTLKGEANFNAYITTAAAEDLRKALIQASLLPDFLMQWIQQDGQKADNPFQQVRLILKESAWSMAWTQKEELPELVVPPIEVLEQREVARRFQRLDELILLEDYEGAIAQCREYLQTNPASLYLVRRWAFLSLWGGLAFEQSHLDLMTKYDPNSLLTLSLWIRKSVAEMNSDILLENLSKLGNNLGHNIVDFGAIDITSLTLPEMLGDAWNEKDDQRAVACYERVLQTRGEVPRILVKLIRLMRDFDDATAEEGYMDRLLACEVPIRTRAAIYFRLAEIKQSEDQEEAVKWALKSWQTNRTQVKYAMLAADLLIALRRAREAVHVMVETCELLTVDHPLPSRVELELKISTIWLNELHRQDLAQERLERARELAGDTAEAFDLILPLAKDLGDPVIYGDLLMQALQSASKAQQHDRANHIVEALLSLADQMGDSEQLGRIYSLILTCSLLDVNQIEHILQRPNLDLPYDKILQAIDWQLDQLDESMRGHYLLLMGDIARQYIHDTNRSRQYYERAFEHGQLNEAAFNYLDEHYARSGLNRQRFELLKSRLNSAGEADRKVILRELYYFDDGVSDTEKDRFAIDMFASDGDDVGPLEERIAFYEMQGHTLGIHELISRAVESTDETEALIPLLHKGLDAVQNTATETRFRYMDEILRQLLLFGMERSEHAQLALQYLWVDPHKTLAKPYLEYLLSIGEVPDLEPDMMLDVLDDGPTKVDLLIRLAGASSDPAKTVNYERQAFRIARNVQGMLSTKLEVLQRLADHTSLTDEELGEYVKAVRQSGRGQHMLWVLGQQIPLARTDVMRDKLFQLAAEFLGLATADSLNLDRVHQAISYLGPEQQNRLKTIWLERIGFDEVLHTRDFAVQMLRDKSFWEHQKAVTLLLKQMLEVWQESGLIKGIVTPILKSLMEDNRENDLRFYLNFLLPYGLVGQSTSLAAFEYFASRRDTVAMERYWLHCLELLENSEQTSRLLDYSKDLLQEVGIVSFLYQTVSELLDHNTLSRFPSEVQRELRLFYAEYLFVAAKDHRKALSLFEQVYAATMDEVRTWGPLIVLYSEFNSDSDLYELLHHILPRLRRDRETVEHYKLDLPALEHDLISIGERLGIKHEPTDVDISFSLPVDLQYGGDHESEQGMGPEGTYVHGQTASLDLSEVNAALVMPPPRMTEISEFQTSDATVTRPRLAVVQANSSDPASQDSPLNFEKFVHNAEPAPMDTKIAQMPVDLSMPTSLAALREPEAQGFSVPALPKGDDDDEPPLATVVAPRPDLTADRSTLMHPRESLQATMLNKEESLRFETPDFPRSTEGDKRLQITFEPEEWRFVAAQGRARDGLCAWLLANPLPDRTEQHIAVQTAAVFEENIQLLENWPYKVWRQPTDYFYDLKWTDRMGREMFHPGIKSPLARLLKTLHPIIVQQFASHMNIKGIAERLKVRSDEILKARRTLEWKDEVIQRSGLRYYLKFLVENSYHLFHVTKLEDRFQFDFEKREIYIDRDYYLGVPPTHLFHRLAFLIRAVSVDYYPYLHLSPSNDLFPFLMNCRRSLEQNRVDSFKRMLGMEKDALKLMLSQADRDYLEQLFVEVGSLSPDKITKIVGVYLDQIYRLNMAESLDLVGVIESISNTNLLTDRISPLALVNQSPSIRTLIAFTADLKFQHKAEK
jgi:hypothetical protein